MIYYETLKRLDPSVKEAVDELFDSAIKNQVHKTDILLVHIHGFKLGKEYSPGLKQNKLNPYVIGPDMIGFSLNSFYEFYDSYRKSIFSKKEFEEKSKSNPNELEIQKFTVEIELLIYLKFWEADLMLRKLYNIANLCIGKPYSWDYNKLLLRQRRKFIREKIQTPLETICPKFYALIDDIYFRQLRNAIAHSKYFISGNNIVLINKQDDPKFYKLSSISFDQWEEIFHKLLLLYNHIIGNFEKINENFIELAKKEPNGLPIYLPKMTNKIRLVKYDNVNNRWI